MGRMHERTRQWQGRSSDWREVGKAYRMHLFGEGEQRLGDPRTGKGARPGIDPERVEAVIARDEGNLSVPQVLRQRVRYFCDGAVFGSREFVEAVFEKHRERFGVKRKTGSRKMRGAEWGNLATLRDLQNAVSTQTES